LKPCEKWDGSISLGNDAKLAATLRTGRNVDLKHPLEALHSQHWFRISKAAMGRQQLKRTFMGVSLFCGAKPK
jgi:hypothetical protein